MPDLTGLWLTNVTPFTAEGAVDHDAFSEHVAWLVDNGVERFVPAGNTGEYASLDAAEVVHLTELTRESAPNGVVVAGVGGPIGPTLELTRAVMAAGADAVMVHHPVHTHAGRDGLAAYFRQIAEAADGKVVLYKRSHRVSDDLVVELLREGSAIAVKYAVNDLIAFKRAQVQLPDAHWICGTAELWAPFFQLLGAVGFTSGLGNAAPRISVAMEDALRRNDLGRVMELRELVRDLEELRAEEDAAKNVPVIRAAMELAGYRIGPPRPPLAELSREDALRVARSWQAWTAADLVTAASDTGPG